jgi:hypothetical protein
LLFVVRYGIGVAMVLAGVILLIAVPGTGVDGFAMAVGGGLATLMINGLYRLGVSGDEDRVREERARRYFDEHGEWPEEEERSSGHRWALPAGVATLEDELRQRESGQAMTRDQDSR